MDQRTRVALAVAATVGLFLTVQLGALSLAPTFEAQGLQATENPDDATNSLAYVGVILVATAGMLLLIKLGAEQVIRGVVLLTTGLLSWYVLSVVLWKVLGPTLGAGTITWLAPAAAVLVVAALLVHPEWYVIDAAGVLMGAGAAGLFGISFGVLPALVLLVVLAVYDAISVYGTEHMLTLAEGVMDLNVPILLVVPTSLSFSMADLAGEGGSTAGEGSPAGDGSTSDDGSITESGSAAGNGSTAGERGATTDGDVDPDGVVDGRSAAETADGGGSEARGDAMEEDPLGRDALFLGLGDVVVPTVLVASAGFFLQQEAPPLVDGLALNLPALGAMAGTVAGLLLLLGLVFRGRPHAGLPLLNGGAILGYLAGALAAGIPLSAAFGL